MRTQKLWRLLVVIFLVFLICLVIPAFARTTYQSDKFPLEEKWSVHLPNSIEAISVDGDIIFARTTDALYALHIDAGRILWSHKLSWQPAPKPAIARNGVVYVADGKTLWVLNEKNGSIAWKYSVSYYTASVADVSNKFVVLWDLNFYDVINSLDGSTILKIPYSCRAYEPAYIDGSNVNFICRAIITIDIPSGNKIMAEKAGGMGGNTGEGDGIIYYSPSQPLIVAFDTRSQSKIWQTPKSISGIEHFNVWRDYLFFTDLDEFCALQRKDGEILWCSPIQYPQNPTVIGDVVYIFNGNSTQIAAINIENGKITGKLTLGNFNFFSTYRELMASSGGWLIFGSNREIFAFR